MEQPHNLPLKVYQDERDYMMVPGFHTGSLILICFFTGGIRGHPKWYNRLRGIWKRDVTLRRWRIVQCGGSVYAMQSLTPALPMPWVSIRQVYGASRLESAISSLQFALSIQPDLVIAHQQLAQLFSQKRQFDLAIWIIISK